MATSIELSKITKVDLRDCWKNEATDFTSWLAKDENIALLADAVGINELEVKAQEEHVGPFRADILCVDPGTDKYVLIENQLEKTDHNHLGQILTYAAGLDAVTIIWIAERFTEEHRAAIDWLNSITDKEFNFFGVEVELIKIGNSPAAPMFNVIAKPNGWSKDVKSSKASGEGRTETEMFKYEFWSAFNDYMANHPSELFHTQSASYDHWMNIAIGKGDSVQFYIWNDTDKKYFDALVKYKDEAEKQVGHSLTWRRLDGKKTSTIDLFKKCKLKSESEREAIFAWMREYTEKFVGFFKPIIKDL